MKVLYITIIFFMCSVNILAEYQPIKKIYCVPSEPTVDDTIYIKYDFTFPNLAEKEVSTEIQFVDDTIILINEYYDVSDLFTPTFGTDSVCLGKINANTYKVLLAITTLYGNNYGNSDSIIISVKSGVNIDESESVQRNKLFPNPATNTITLEEIEPNSILTLYNTLGKKVLRQMATGNEETLDVSTLPKGLYFITIKTREGKVVTQKFVKE